MDPLPSCPNCGAAVHPDALRCDACGALTIAVPPPRWRVRAVVGVFGALFLAAAIWGVGWAKGQWSGTSTAAGTTSGSSGSSSGRAPSPTASGSSTAPAATTPSTSGVGVPKGSRLCDSGGDLKAYAGSTRTSCTFAITVRDAYVGAGGLGDGSSRQVRAHSTVTDTTYLMTCTGKDLVTCEGGTDAVIYLLP